MSETAARGGGGLQRFDRSQSTWQRAKAQCNVNQTIRLLVIWFCAMVCAVIVVLSMYLYLFVVQDALVARQFNTQRTCTVVEKDIEVEERTCMCGHGCVSRFKCARVFVTVLQPDGEQSEKMLIHENQHSVVHHGKCSLRRCTADAAANNAAVDAFYDTLTNKQQLQCRTGAHIQTGKVVLEIDPVNTAEIVASILTPLVLFLLFLSIAIYCCRKSVRAADAKKYYLMNEFDMDVA